MNVRQKITDYRFLMPKGSKIFLFGSSLTTETPNDIDILITYDKQQIDIGRALEIRKAIQKEIFDLTGIPGEILLLSLEENRETEFTKNIRTQRLLSSCAA